MKKEYIKPKIIIIKTYNDDALLQQHRFVISTNAILLKILPAKVAKVAKTDRTPAMVDSFGMINNFISRYSKKYKA